MNRRITSVLAAALIAAATTLAPTASAVTPVSPSPFNPRGVAWPADYGQLPAQTPVATFANNAGTARCGVYNVDGQHFVKCLSFIDSMPGHMCINRSQVNAMILGTGDAWDCANRDDFAGAPAIGPLQVRRFGDVIVYSDARNNFTIGYSNFSRAIRVGEVNDRFEPLAGSSLSSLSSMSSARF